jgi:hypothetical protein
MAQPAAVVPDIELLGPPEVPAVSNAYVRVFIPGSDRKDPAKQCTARQTGNFGADITNGGNVVNGAQQYERRMTTATKDAISWACTLVFLLFMNVNLAKLKSWYFGVGALEAEWDGFFKDFKLTTWAGSVQRDCFGRNTALRDVVSYRKIYWNERVD